MFLPEAQLYLCQYFVLVNVDEVSQCVSAAGFTSMQFASKYCAPTQQRVHLKVQSYLGRFYLVSRDSAMQVLFLPDAEIYLCQYFLTK